MLTRDSIVNAALPIKIVSAPAWGGDVGLRTLTASEVETLLGSSKEKSGFGFAAALLCLCLCDDKGARLFEDGDEVKLMGRDTATLQALFHEAASHNGLDESSQERAEKN